MTRSVREAGWIGKVLLLMTLLLAVGAAAAWLVVRQWQATPIVSADGDPVTVIVPAGSSFRQAMSEVARATGNDRVRWLNWWVRLSGEGASIKAGEYALAPGLLPGDLLDLLKSGKVVLHRFTLVEGWTIWQLRTALAAESLLNQESASWSDERLMTALGAEGVHPEGRFLPDTYFFARGTRDLELLRRAFVAMQAAIAETWAARGPDLPLQSPDEMLVLASIIERETAVESERREVAGVFVRRLQKDMRLQTDPTVIYGLGPGFNGDITRADLRRDTPYNTYTRKGLPPTPIAMPGRRSLQAAVKPLPGTTLFFVATGDGGHHFSTTLQEHNAAVARYLSRLRQNRSGQP